MPTEPHRTPAVPPVDKDGHLDEANKLRKRFAGQLQELPAEWRTWVLRSLDAQFAGETKGEA